MCNTKKIAEKNRPNFLFDGSFKSLELLIVKGIIGFIFPEFY